MYNFPLSPIIFPRTIASRPICDPILRTVFPGFIKRVMILMFLASQVPQFLMKSETPLS